MAADVQVGGVSITRVIEEEGPFRPIRKLFPELAPEVLDENRAWLRAAGALDGDDVMRIAVQSFLVRTPHHLILIDTCVGNDKDRPNHTHWSRKRDTAYMDALAAAGVSVEDIDYVLCTHLHVDHVGWNTRLENGRWVPTFPRARYVFGAEEYAYWEAEHAKVENAVFADSVLPIVAAGRAERVGSEHAIGDHVRLTPTPGHTPGHVAVRLGLKDEAVVSGDLIHSPLQARYPEMSIVFDVDKAQAARTRRAFLEGCADAGTVCCMTHFPSPSIGRLARWGEGFRCEALA